MSEQKVTADYNFIRNGDFQNDLEDGWTLNDPAKVTKQTDLWDGVPTAHMRLVNKGEAEQTITLRDLPRPTTGRAVYRVSFWYQATQGAVCWVVLKPGKGGQQCYDLIPTLDPEEGEDPEEPLDLRLELMERDIQLEADETEVTVCFGSPANDQPGMLRGLRVTQIKVELRLEDLRLKQVWLDGAPQDLRRPLRLCLGAAADQAATLRFEPADDSVWKGTDIGLLVDGAIPAPGAPVSVLPDGEHLIESPWQISCADLPDEEGVRHELLIESAFTANPYVLETLSGHFRLDVVAVKEAAYYPVIDLKQTVELVARVQSHYTAQPLAGRMVRWYRGEVELSNGETDESGEARFDYEPDVMGKQQIVAKVDSFYKPEDALHVFEVWALQSDPWLDVQVRLDALALGSWDKVLYPNRGGSHEIWLTLPEGSPLLDTDLILFSISTPDTPESLQVTFDPLLSQPHPQSATLMRWAMVCGNWKNGQFSLQLESSRLKERSNLKPMSLAHNWVEKGWVKEATRFPSLDSPVPLPLALQVKSKISNVLEAKEVDVLWTLEPDKESLQTGVDGVSEYEFIPIVEGSFKVTAKVDNRYDDTSFTHDFNVTVIGEEPWLKMAILTMNDKEPGSIGIYAFLEDEGTLKLMPSGDGLLDQEIYLGWPDTNPDLGLVTDPPMEQRRKLTSTGLSWKVKFNSTESARFDLQVCCDMLDPWTVPGRALSRSIDVEGSLALDQVMFESQKGAYPCIGAQHDLWFWPKVNSPLSGLKVALRFRDAPEDKLNILFSPELDLAVRLDASGIKWQLGCLYTQRIEPFSLELFFPELDLIYSSIHMSLGVHRFRIAAERQPPMDTVLTDSEQSQMGLQVVSYYNGHPVRDVQVKFELPGRSDVTEPTGQGGWAMCRYVPPTADDFVVKASLQNRYSGETLSTEFSVKALEKLPWDDLKFQFNDDPQPDQIGRKTAFPRRGGNYTIKLKPDNASNPLVGRAVALGVGGIEARDIGAILTPDWGQSQMMTAEGVSWRLQLGDIQDASFNVFASASRLAKLSPGNTMSLGSIPLPASYAVDDQFDK